MTLPLELVRNGAKRASEQCETRNLSSRGVLFRTGMQATPGQRLEYIITLARDRQTTVRLRCLGKVVRQAGENEIAATLDRYEFIRS